MAPMRRQRRRPRRARRSAPTPGTAAGPIVPRPVAWLPRRHTLKYATTVTLNAGIGTSDVYVFVANGLYDPDYTSTGHQPYGFDQLMSIYNHYTVIAASVVVRPNAPGGDVNIAYGVSISGSANDLSGLSPDNIIELPGTPSYRMLARYTVPQPVRNSVNLPKFFGASNIVGKDPYQGTAAANPTEQAFFTVWVGGVGSLDPGATAFVVEITFDAWFTEPRTLASS